jgi:Holliday junction DNA helicase RuvA
VSGPIARLRGTILEVERDALIVEAGGVGYRVYVPAGAIERAGTIGEQVRLYIHEYIKEDVHQLFGFLTAEELETFTQLLSVTGIGPRGALAFLSAMSPAELAAALARRDVEALSRVRGIGRKTAERVIYELAGKVSAPAGVTVPAGLAARTGDEAAAALMAVGYGAQEIAAALAQIPGPGEASTEERVFLAMRVLDRWR